MQTPSKPWKISAVLTALLLAGCATSSPPTQPPVISEGVKLTPLPSSVQSIDSKPSADYLLKVQGWLSRVEGLSSAGTPK